jgi:pyruvate/2-oxoglutarate dehydrogenase complex dihydrolipoamide acyltransferase (E2) component
MSTPLYVPRINNNDDFVKVVRLGAAVGDHVRRSDIVAEIESDKSVASVEAEQDGYVLKVLCAVDDQVAVGGVMMWLGASADEVVADAVDESAAAGRRGTAEPTAKARALLTKYGLTAQEVTASSDRLSAADVEAHVAQRTTSMAEPGRGDQKELLSLSAGDIRPLSVAERGMLHTVSWHRDQAAAAYLEIEFDSKPWDDHAAAFAAQHKLMMSPMLPLMAYRLVTLVGETAKINATLVDGQLYQYREINLGFTVQAGETLYLVVARNAGSMDAAGFVSTLGELQRHAIGKKLRPEESQGTTVGFSSMARWNVSRHIPILAPYTSLMVAHAAARQSGMAVLGATYDHRILSGFDVWKVLNKLTRPSGDATA